MSKLEYRVAHAVPAFMVGGLVWCLLAMVLSRMEPGVLGYFALPGNSTWVILGTAGSTFFALFLFLRWLDWLNLAAFSGGLALLTLILVLLGNEPQTMVLALLVAMSAVSGAIAFMVLRGGARADLRIDP